ncbi:hypothetical protein HDC95_000264 [Microbacterium sp. AK031]|nr:hypothetical protein [Microbacterium sp. AK031]
MSNSSTTAERDLIEPGLSCTPARIAGSESVVQSSTWNDVSFGTMSGTVSTTCSQRWFWTQDRTVSWMSATNLAQPAATSTRERRL